MTLSHEEWLFAPSDTGPRRRSSDRRPLAGDLIDVPTVESIVQETWTALVGEEEVILPIPGELPADVVSSWVDIVGPWTGSVVLTTAPDTAEELCRALLGPATPPVVDDEDVADAFGEIANVVGGNVKAALPGPSGLSLPQVGDAPAVRNPADQLGVDVLWRGEPVSVSVQGALPPCPVAPPRTRTDENEVSL